MAQNIGLGPYATITTPFNGSTIKQIVGGQFFINVDRAVYCFDGYTYQSPFLISPALYSLGYALLGASGINFVAVAEISSEYEYIQVNGVISKIDRYITGNPYTTGFNTSAGNIIGQTVPISGGGPYRGLIFFNFNNSSYQTLINTTENSAIGGETMALMFYDEYTGNLYFAPSLSGSVYVANISDNFQTSKLIYTPPAGYSLVFMTRYIIGIYSTSDIELITWGGIYIFNILYKAINSNFTYPSFNRTGISARNTLNSDIVFFPFTSPIFINYYQLQRHFAHNYSRGIPIQGGLQGLILPPNTNTIL